MNKYQKKVIHTIWQIILMVCALTVIENAAHATPVMLTDDQLSKVTGQALIYSNKTYDATQGLTFYTFGLDTQLAINANINKLQLGCGGINGPGGCDIDIDRFSMSGTPGVNGCPSSGTLASCDLLMTRPSITIAISGDSTPARQVVGVQLGAQKFVGTLGFGSINNFSGYLTAAAAVTMQAGNDVAVTCGTDTGPCKGTAQQYCSSSSCSGPPGSGSLSGGITSTGENQYGYTGSQSLGLKDDYTCATFIFTLCATFDGLTVNTPQQTSSGSVLLSGNRLTQAQVSGLNLGTTVENIASGLTFNQSKGLPSWLLNLIKGTVQTSVELSIENQMGAALACNQSTEFNTCSGITPQSGSNCTNTSYTCIGTSTTESTQAANLNKYIMPYNVSNVHNTAINSSNFGLSFEQRAVQWPNYAAAVPTGWAMYMPNAFTLQINQPLSTFTSNIISGAASAGNIAPLPGPPQNCFGTPTFC